MMKIQNIYAQELLDSRGYPTVEATVQLEGERLISGSAMVPSGASTGVNEALELRDLDPKRYTGKGVQQAIDNIEKKIAPSLMGHSVFEQQKIDQQMIELDQSPNKSNLGANSILAVSLAVARAAANARDIPLYQYLSNTFESGLTQQKKYLLPVPQINLINGGVHADNSLDFQEFMIMPIGASCFSDAIRYSVEIFQALKSLLKQRGLSTNVGDEGGFAPNITNHESALDFLIKACEQAGFKVGLDQEIVLGIDAASSELFDAQSGDYYLASEKKRLTGEEWIGYWEKLCKNYPLYSIEDPISETDWTHWEILSRLLRDSVQLVGDDLFVTHTELLNQGIENKIANAILIKLNQVGTITETQQTILAAQKAGYEYIISHRSGETEDPFIADFAVGTFAKQIKMGSVSRSERLAKYNQLLRIEKQLGSHQVYAGKYLRAQKHGEKNLNENIIK